MKTIKTGIVGCGYWGPNLIRNLRLSPDCDLKLICDTDERRLDHMRRLHPDVATTTRFDDLLNDDVEAVAIATPARLHHEMAKACLKAGKHVFVEKPMTRTEVEAEELVQRNLSKSATLDYWESGMDLGLSRDMFDSFLQYQTAMQSAFRELQKTYGFNIVDGNRSVQAVTQELRKKIGAVLAAK